jgi:hypothetical protein
MVVREGITYYFQTGRTIMKVSSQPEWSFFDSLFWGGFSNPSSQPIQGDQSPEELELNNVPSDPFHDMIG